MADNMGMFGMSPELVQRQLQQQDQERALQFAKLDPMQQATMGMYQGGQALGRSLGGMLGGTDPMLERAKAMQDMSKSIYESGVDPSDPSKFFPAMIKEAQSRGMSDLVMPLMKQYQDTMDKMATAEYHRAMADKTRNDKYETKLDQYGRFITKTNVRTGDISVVPIGDMPSGVPVAPSTSTSPAAPTSIPDDQPYHFKDGKYQKNEKSSFWKNSK